MRDNQSVLSAESQLDVHVALDGLLDLSTLPDLLRPLVILVPLRLGIGAIQPEFYDAIMVRDPLHMCAHTYVYRCVCVCR